VAVDSRWQLDQRLREEATMPQEAINGLANTVAPAEEEHLLGSRGLGAVRRVEKGAQMTPRDRQHVWPSALCIRGLATLLSTRLHSVSGSVPSPDASASLPLHVFRWVRPAPLRRLSSLLRPSPAHPSTRVTINNTSPFIFFQHSQPTL
jgi:hypothetical protein